MRSVVCHWLKFVLAFALVAAPLVPAVGGPHHAGVERHDSASIDARAHHAEHESIVNVAVDESTCEQHVECAGQCCATCAQCFTTTPSVGLNAVPAQPIQRAVVLTLRILSAITLLNRPPQAV